MEIHAASCMNEWLTKNSSSSSNNVGQDSHRQLAVAKACWPVKRASNLPVNEVLINQTNLFKNSALALALDTSFINFFPLFCIKSTQIFMWYANKLLRWVKSWVSSASDNKCSTISSHFSNVKLLLNQRGKQNYNNNNNSSDSNSNHQQEQLILQQEFRKASNMSSRRMMLSSLLLISLGLCE